MAKDKTTIERFDAAMKRGDKAEVREILLEELKKAELSPTILKTLRDGTVACYRGKKRVIPDPDKPGYWKLFK